MPRYRQQTPTAAPTQTAQAGQGRYATSGRYSAPAVEPRVQEDGPGWGTAALGAGALGVTGLALKNPKMLGKAADFALAARYVPMLSGFALPKSVAGNVGAIGMSSLERRSLEPIKQFLTKQTARDFVRELKNPTARGSGAVQQQAGRYNPFGRVMGAADEATQGALQRAGMTPAQSAEQTLQTPLPSQWAKPLGTRLGQTMVPFQRTPFNQFIQTFKASSEHPGIAGAAAATGAAVGAGTEDWRTPGLAAPFTGRYSGPFALGAVAGRAYSGGKDAARTAFGLSPTSDESMAGPIMDPLRSYKGSLWGMLKYLGLMEDTE